MNMMDMNNTMEQCMNTMGSGSMMGGLLFAVLGVLLLVWLIGLAAIGGLGFWVYSRLRTH